MKAKAKSITSAPAAPKIHNLDDYPDVFAMECDGDCMAPQHKHGEVAIIDKRKPAEAGDLVVFFLKPEFVKAGQHQARIKRLVLNMMPGVKYPYKPHPDSNIMPVLIVEQLNPPGQYQIPASALLGVYKASRMPADAVYDAATKTWSIPEERSSARKTTRNPIKKKAA